MYMNYILLSCLLSLSISGLLAVAAARTEKKRRDDIFSASLGIIIFVCVKSIVTDCGWSFAALFGVPCGFAAQMGMTLGAFVFFRELRRSERAAARLGSERLAGAAALLCFGVGRNLMCDYGVVADPSLYVLGEAAEYALLTAAVQMSGEEGDQRTAPHMIRTAATVIGSKTAVCVLLRLRYDFHGTFGGTVLLTVGIAGLVYQFAYALGQDREVTAGGFAAGFAAALCTASLLG